MHLLFGGGSLGLRPFGGGNLHVIMKLHSVDMRTAVTLAKARASNAASGCFFQLAKVALSLSP